MKSWVLTVIFSRQIMTTITSALSDILTPTQFAPMLTAMLICKTVVLFVTALTITKWQYFAINYIRRGIAASSQTNMTITKLYWEYTAVSAEGNGDLQTLICVLVARPRRCHIVESCPLTKLNGGLSRLHSADDDAVSWLTSCGWWHAWHAYEKKIDLYHFHQINSVFILLICS